MYMRFLKVDVVCLTHFITLRVVFFVYVLSFFYFFNEFATEGKESSGNLPLLRKLYADLE